METLAFGFWLLEKIIRKLGDIMTYAYYIQHELFR